MAGCRVLKCTADSAHVLLLGRQPDMPLLETVVCEFHHGEIEDGQPWQWDDQDSVVLMGIDLDGGGALVPVDWKITHDLGGAEVVIQCHTPSGEYHGPVRLRIPEQHFGDWARFLTSIEMGKTPLH